MKSRLIAALPLALSLAGTGPVLAQPKTIEIVIERFVFKPARVTVAPGDTVVFTNRDIVPHTATAADSSWSTPELARGESARIVVPAEGDGSYFCAFHPMMKGRLAVKAR